MMKEYFGCKVFVDEVINKQHIDNILSGVDFKSYTSYNQSSEGKIKNWQCRVNTGLGEKKGVETEGWFDGFLRGIQHEISYYIRETMVHHPNAPESYAVQSWINYYEKGHWQERHGHTGPRGGFSFNYIHKFPVDSGDFAFYNPVTDMQMGWFKFYDDKITVPATEGTLILFPPWLQHSVGFNNSDEPRITISGNITFSDNLGDLE